jgi:hypothetical protein
MLMPTPPPFSSLELPPPPWSLEEFRAAVERQRGRRLIAEPAPLSSSGSAIWIATWAADLIVYDQAAHPAQQLRSIGHQLGHMLLGHQANPGGDQSLFPHLDPDAVSAALSTSSYAQADELAAEEFATLLITNAMRSPETLSL